MKLSSASVDQARNRVSAQPIAEDHPVAPQLAQLFGNHTRISRRRLTYSCRADRPAQADEAMTNTVRELPELSISTEKICFIIAKAEEFDAKDVVTEPDPGSNPTDDGMLSVLEDHKDDPVVAELAALFNAMTEDEQVELVTLTWLGRGEGTLADWDELRAEAARVHNKHTARYLLGTPLLADYLMDALLMFGRSCDEFDVA
jgi:hypothetical protein